MGGSISRQDGYKITLLAEWAKTPRNIEQKIDPSLDTKTEALRLIKTEHIVPWDRSNPASIRPGGRAKSKR